MEILHVEFLLVFKWPQDLAWREENTIMEAFNVFRGMEP
jgi:hypothetical protein